MFPLTFTEQETFRGEASHAGGTEPQPAESQGQGALQLCPVSFPQDVLWFARLGLINHRNVLSSDISWGVLTLWSWQHMEFRLLYLPVPKVPLRWGRHDATCPGESPHELCKLTDSLEGPQVRPGEFQTQNWKGGTNESPVKSLFRWQLQKLEPNTSPFLSDENTLPRPCIRHFCSSVYSHKFPSNLSTSCFSCSIS